MVVGVLALQGDFAEHITMLKKLGVTTREVRSLNDLSGIDRLIIPGGESTVISRFLQEENMMETLRSGSIPILGTCAGAIMLAKEVTGKNPPETLKLMDITIDRNAYGTQSDSFMTEISVEGIGKKQVSFIRAPRMGARVGAGARILVSHEGTPVLVQEGRYMAATFHTEIGVDPWLHELFLVNNN